MGTNYRSYVKERVDADVYTLALARVAETFDRFDTVCVSFSGGKDSTVCLELCADEAERRGRRLLIHFNDEEAIPTETAEYVERCRVRLQERLGDKLEFYWYCLPFRNHNVCSRREQWWYTWDPACPEKWCRPMPEGDHVITPPHPLMEQYGNTMAWGDFSALELSRRTPVLGTVASVLGIRADESLTRTHAVIQKRRDNWLVPARTYGMRSDRLVPGVTKVYPIYDWTTPDVWRAPSINGWDYNRAYDRLDAWGIPPDSQRFAQPTAAESIVGLTSFAECFPDVWQRLVQRVPGVATAYRYGLTELYSYGADPEPGEGETWTWLLERQIDKWGSELRDEVREKVYFYVNYHYKRTSDPIIDVPHPDSGISWPFLIKVAIRGDLKERMRWYIGFSRKAARANPDVHKEAMERWLQNPRA